MENHFSKGLMAGLKTHQPWSASQASQFCPDYRRGFVLGFSWNQAQITGDRQKAAWQAGVLTREYELDKTLVVDFFSEQANDPTVKSFFDGYEKGR